MADKQIVWERWYDPLKSAIDDYKSVVKDCFTEHLANEHIPAEMILDRPFPVRGPILISNIGPIPIHEGNCPDKIFKFWIGHTNFDITQEVFDKIEKIPGVEILNIWTRYRFRLGVGKAFEDRDVMNEIDRLVAGKETYLEGKALVDKLADSVKQHKREFYVVDENGTLRFLDTKPKGVNTIYDHKPKKQDSEKGSRRRGDKSGDAEQGQQGDNQDSNG